MKTLQELKAIRDEAFSEWESLNVPADAAYEKYESAVAQYKDALCYEKAKRQVMRDLIKSAGKISEQE
jgi:hypothetical protein